MALTLIKVININISSFLFVSYQQAEGFTGKGTSGIFRGVVFYPKSEMDQNHLSWLGNIDKVK